MRRVFAVLALLAFTAFAGDFVYVEGTVAGGNTDQDYLQYDDGTINWLTWAGVYRGTWFNTDDFLPGQAGFATDFTEYWMYHHSSYPWDVSDFYAELWNGDFMAPTTLLDEQVVTALHYAPVFANYSTPIDAESDFWGLEDTEMSAGGWPAILADGTGYTVACHSYYSEDFFIWEPWSDQTVYGDFFVRAEGVFIPDALDHDTWAGIKSTF
jgi:hypothetical protein